MKGAFLDLKTLDRADLQLSKMMSLPVYWSVNDHTPAAETADYVADANIIVTNKVVIDASVMDRAPHLKLICVAATGTNNVDLKAARDKGIRVTNVPGYSTPSVVQHVFALVLSLTNSLPQYQQRIREGAWQKSNCFCMYDFPVYELQGKVFGAIGYGELGRGVARLAEAFGMKVLIAQRPGSSDIEPGRVPLDQLLEESDVISLHVPLAANTVNLISSREIAMMKDHAILINTSRGGIVDESALAKALRNGKIGGAGVDVLTSEPPVKGNVLLDASIPNLIVTPHIAWASQEARQRLIDEIVLIITDYLAGRSRHRVV